MIRHNFCRSDGRLVKLVLFSTLLHKSPLTCTYFATFEKKREIRSPLPHNRTFWFLANYYIVYYITIHYTYTLYVFTIQYTNTVYLRFNFQSMPAIFGDISDLVYCRYSISRFIFSFLGLVDLKKLIWKKNVTHQGSLGIAAF